MLYCSFNPTCCTTNYFEIFCLEKRKMRLVLLYKLVPYEIELTYLLYLINKWSKSIEGEGSPSKSVVRNEVVKVKLDAVKTLW